MQASKEKWLFIHEWIAKNDSKIRSFVYKRYYLKYSPYPLDDFVAEAYLVAYEALSICGDKPFEGYFWALLKQKCKLVLANQPHQSFFINSDYVPDSAYEVNYDECFDEDDVQSIIKYLNVLSPQQKQVCRLIAFSTEPVTLEDIAKIVGITYWSVLKRFNKSIKRIEEARLSEEV